MPRKGNPVSRSIMVTGRKESKRDARSKGDRTGYRPLRIPVRKNREMWIRPTSTGFSQTRLEERAEEGDRPVDEIPLVMTGERLGRTGISDRIREYMPPKSKYVWSPIAHQYFEGKPKRNP